MAPPHTVPGTSSLISHSDSLRGQSGDDDENVDTVDTLSGLTYRGPASAVGRTTKPLHSHHSCNWPIFHVHRLLN